MAAEIDIYDNIEEDFVHDSADLNELFDENSSPSSNPLFNPESKQILTSSGLAHSGRRIATYVGNLTWWTSDVDIYQAFNNIGIFDVLEVKFNENRQNGQSKGFCVVVFGSETSVRIAMEKLPKVILNGQPPVITYCTKNNLSIFEKAAGCDTSMPSSTGTREYGSGVGGVLGASSIAGLTRNSATNGRLPPPLMGATALPVSLGFSMRGCSSLMGSASAPLVRNPATGLPINLSALPQNFQNLLMPPNALNMHLSPALAPNQNPGYINPGFVLPSGAITSLAGTNAHINPNFLQQNLMASVSQSSNQSSIPNPLFPPSQLTSGLRPQVDPFGRPLVQTYTPGQGGKLNESEFEDILQRNKTVSSSAINRAVQDAAGGDYASAIETLVTAISLIKQSKIANDDRCKILINSLQDTLHGIESKSYGSKSDNRRRRRSYSDSDSEGADEDFGGPNSSGSRRSRIERDKNRRSRSRDRRRTDDRRHRSRDLDHDRGGREFYIPSTLTNMVSSSSLATGPGASSSADRYRDNRYRQ